ncbi:MAG: hypothetical protein JRI91_15660 [Deltaproteobacteria bacterium]|nr:hypothetical protein [Deltaproteobacteria bacterium]
MDIKKHIHIILKEIEAYRSHSLFNEAKIKCKELEDLIQQSSQIKNKQKFLTSVTNKIRNLEKNSFQFDKMGASVQMSPEEKALVKKLFSSPQKKGSDSAILEGAIALLVFGQFKGALEEFNKLLNNDSLRVSAAKNIIRCHIGLNDLDNTVVQYQKWFDSGRFTPEQLETIRPFLQGILDKRGITKSLPETESKPDGGEQEIKEEKEEKFIDILSVVISLGDKSNVKKNFELDVSFQRNNVINVIVPGANKALVDYMKVGSELKNVQFFSYNIIFMGSCFVSDKNQINFGPKKGNYSVIMKISDT